MSAFSGSKRQAALRSAAIELLEPRQLLSGTSHRPSVTVHAGDSIQAAVDAALPGTDILIDPGTYMESVTVAKAGIHLIGKSKGNKGVTLDAPAGAANGVRATAAATGFELSSVTIQNFANDGVILVGVAGFELDHVITTNNGAYGLFPIKSTNGVIEGCVASGQADTGIYVGQSENVAVRGCSVFNNVEGISIENCSHVDVTGNLAYDNVIGIASFLLPGLTVKTSSDIDITGNVVLHNNHVNFGDPDDLASKIPTGTGIMVLGTDSTRVQANVVFGNQFAGIVVASSLTLAVVAGFPPAAFADIDPSPDNDVVRFNIALGNGTQPIPVFGGADLLWDGSGTGNHWSNNLFKTASPSPLP